MVEKGRLMKAMMWWMGACLAAEFFVWLPWMMGIQRAFDFYRGIMIAGLVIVGVPYAGVWAYTRIETWWKHRQWRKRQAELSAVETMQRLQRQAMDDVHKMTGIADAILGADVHKSYFQFTKPQDPTKWDSEP